MIEESSVNTPVLAGIDVYRALQRADLFADIPSLGQVQDSISGITDDSRLVRQGTAFLAVDGSIADGHSYVREAVGKGACLLIVQNDISVELSVPVWKVKDSNKARALLASLMYDSPASGMTLVGVTGTNGKTTTVHIIRELLSDLESPVASIGTLGVILNGENILEESLTTPGVFEIQRILRLLKNTGVKTVVMEVSSHALSQGRVDGLMFDAVVFTSFSRDHLDYHLSMEEYFEAKKKLLQYLKPEGTAVINSNETAWKQLPFVENSLTYGYQDGDNLYPEANIIASNISFREASSTFDLTIKYGSDVTTHNTSIPLLGQFNIGNAVAALSICLVFKKDCSAILSKLKNVAQVPGRMERLLDSPTVIRDYAHTPDALQVALNAIRPFVALRANGQAKLHLVFGCGGDRDKGKRPMMGSIAEKGADVVTLTSDNPRTEDPEAILDEIETGMSNSYLPETRFRIEDRFDAIDHAIKNAGSHDIVLLAGKGHEVVQIRGKEKTPFDEAKIVKSIADIIALSKEERV